MTNLIDAASAATPQNGQELEAQAEIARAHLDAARGAHEAAKAAEHAARQIAQAASARQAQLFEKAAAAERAALDAAIRDESQFVRLAKDHATLAHQATVLQKAVEHYRAFDLRNAERAARRARLYEIQAEYDAIGTRHDFLLNQVLCEMKSAALRFNGGALELSEDQFSSGAIGGLRRELGRIDRMRSDTEKALAAFDAETGEARLKYETEKRRND